MKKRETVTMLEVYKNGRRVGWCIPDPNNPGEMLVPMKWDDPGGIICFRCLERVEEDKDED